MNTIMKVGIAIAAYTLVVASPARAGTIFTNEASFLAALNTLYTENYASLPLGSLSTPYTFSGNGFAYDTGGVRVVPSPVDTNALQELVPGAIDLNFFNFSGGGVDGIGGYFYNAFENGVLLGGNFQLLFSDGFLTSVFSPAGGVPVYFGYIGDTKLTSLRGHSILYATVDRLTVGNVVHEVPESSTLGMFGVALLGVIAYSRNRMRAVLNADLNR